MSRNVGGSSVASPFGPVTTNWLAWQHRRQPDDLEPGDRAVGVREDAAVDVRGRVGRIGTQAPAGDVDRRLAEQIVEPVARVDAVRDDRRDVLERAEPARVAARDPARGSRGLVADRGLDQQRPPECAGRDQLPQPVDGGVVAVREPDLEPLGCPGGVADLRGLGHGERERLLREHPLARLERGSDQARRSPTGGVASTTASTSGSASTDAGSVVARTPGGAAARRSSSMSATATQLDAFVADERRNVRADGDVAEADQPDPREERRSRVRP